MDNRSINVKASCPNCSSSLVFKNVKSTDLEFKCPECKETFNVNYSVKSNYLELLKDKKAILILVVLGLLLLVCSCCFTLLVTNTPESTDTQNDAKVFDEEINTTRDESIIPTPTEEPVQYYSVESITDGDTLRIIFEGVSTPVRLLAIEAPELSHPSLPTECYATESKNALEELLSGKDIRIEYDSVQSERDQYDRLLAYVYVQQDDEELFVNEYMIQYGYASVYTDLPSDFKDEFLELQDSAKSTKKGMWSDSCACEKKEVSRECTSCNEATVTFSNWDCSEYTAKAQDSSCSSMCVTSNPDPDPAPPVQTYTCNCSKTCGQISSCQEAYFQLNTCGCNARDGDNDGVPCESLCN